MQEVASGKKGSGKSSKETLVSPTGGRKDGGASGRSLDGGGSGSIGGGSVTTIGKPGTLKGKGRFELPGNKLANKSTDSNDTTSSDGNGFSSKGSSQSDSGGGGSIGSGVTAVGGGIHSRGDTATLSATSSSSSRTVEFAADGGEGGARGGFSSLRLSKTEQQNLTDLSRTESMSSTCSTLSIFGTLPSRNHSFMYDGGESSLDMEIGNSEENLQVCVCVHACMHTCVYACSLTCEYVCMCVRS